MARDSFIYRVFWSKDRLEDYWWERARLPEGRDAYRSRLSDRFGKNPAMIAEDFCTNRIIGLAVLALMVAHAIFLTVT